ncbi:hypothetical protein CCR90_03670 [Rhodovulum sulfidophilum]|nr:hypothetical protein [Rhodovulum sulfidophilum]
MTGASERLFLESSAAPDFECVLIDSTICKAHADTTGERGAKPAPGAIMTYVRSFDPEASNALQRMLSDRIGTVETAAEPTGREAQRTARLFNRFEGTLSGLEGHSDDLRAGKAVMLEEARFAEGQGRIRAFDIAFGGGGLVLDGPDRGQHLQDLGLPDVRNRHPTDFRKSIFSQRLDPLLGMLGILPGWEPLDVNGAGNLFKARYYDILVELWVHAGQALPAEVVDDAQNPETTPV